MMLLQSIVASIVIFDFSGWLIRCKSNRETIYWKIIYCFLSSFINNSSDIFYCIMSVSGLLRMKGYDENFWKIYFSSFPINVVFGYFSSIFWNVILDKVLRRKEA